jgi:hypothetical protein
LTAPHLLNFTYVTKINHKQKSKFPINLISLSQTTLSLSLPSLSINFSSATRHLRS